MEFGCIFTLAAVPVPSVLTLLFVPAFQSVAEVWTVEPVEVVNDIWPATEASMPESLEAYFVQFSWSVGCMG